MKTLIVYYSRTGMTKKVAQSLAEKMGWDIEEIIDAKNRSGVIGYIASGRDVLFSRKAVIKETALNPADYDLVIIGTPVWAATVSTPVGTYLEKHKGSYKKIAFFCTMGGTGNSRLFKAMEKKSGLAPESIMEITDKEIVSGSYISKIDNFLKSLVK